MLDRMEIAINAGIASGLHLGAQACVMSYGQIVASRAWGEARSGTPLTPDHIACWFSAGKPITAVTIAILVQRGLVTFDDPVVRHIPGFATHGKDQITLRHLLTHTAGIRSDVTGYPQADWDASIGQICAMRQETGWVPGERAGYVPRNTWFLLGEVVRQVDGRAVETFCRDEIFAPLGMRDTYMAMSSDTFDMLEHRIMPMHVYREGRLVDAGLDTRLYCTRPSPGSSMRSTARDMARFFQMLLNGGSLDSATLLHSQTVDQLVARQRVGMFDQTFKHIMDWGLGIIPNNAHHGPDVPYGFGAKASPRTFGHGGSQSSVAMVDPKVNQVITLIWNGMPGEAEHQRRLKESLGGVRSQ